MSVIEIAPLDDDADPSDVTSSPVHVKTDPDYFVEANSTVEDIDVYPFESESKQTVEELLQETGRELLNNSFPFTCHANAEDGVNGISNYCGNQISCTDASPSLPLEVIKFEIDYESNTFGLSYSNYIDNMTSSTSTRGQYDSVMNVESHKSFTGSRNSKTLVSYECDLCCRKFRKLSHLEAHKSYSRSCAPQNSHLPQKIGDRYHEDRPKQSHTKRKSAFGRRFKCKVCGKTSNNKHQFDEHQQTHGEKPYSCSTCNRAFGSSWSLAKHELIHKGIKPHKCNVCLREFRELGSLRRHTLVHDVENRLKCDLCDKTYTRLQHLKEHRQTHIPVTPNPIESDTASETCAINLPSLCVNGDREFSKTEPHALQELASSAVKPFRCNLCEMSFMTVKNLSQHVLIHNGIKQHECEICHRTFPALSSLQYHQLVHGIDKPLKCDLCHKSYVHPQHLKNHRKKHIDVMSSNWDISNQAVTDGLSADISASLIENSPSSGDISSCDAICDTNNGAVAVSPPAATNPYTNISSSLSETVIPEIVEIESQATATPVHKLYKCNICERSFAAVRSLSRHKLIHDGLWPHQCDKCPKAFREFTDLREHKLIHDDATQLKCDICDKIFTRSASLRKHRSLHSDIKPHVCNICDKTYGHKDSLYRHKREKHTPHQHRNANVMKSRENVLKPLQLKCDICDKTFTRSANLQKHRSLHSDDKAHVCDICDKPYQHKDSLYHHKRAQHVPNQHENAKNANVAESREIVAKALPKEFVCEVCGKGFARKSHLNIHLRIHTGYRPHKCDICERAFMQKYEVMKHRRTHSGERPYKCTVCDKSFSQRVTLMGHMPLHGSEKPYKCHMCEKAFAYASSLKYHMRSHMGQRRFKCDLCDMAFIVRADCQRHRRIHTGEKPYKCFECDMDFRRADALYKHIRKHH